MISDTNYTIVLERLRTARGFKNQDDFIDGIVKKRTYANYIASGNLPIIIFHLLLKRLGLTEFEAFHEFNRLNDDETLNIDNLYKSVVNQDYRAFDHFKMEIDKSEIIVPDNKKLYDFSILIKSFNHREIHSAHYKRQLEDLVDYPNCINHEIHTMTELLILSEVLYLETKEKQKIIIDKILELIHSKSLVSPHEKNDKLIYLVARLANHLGTQNNNDEVIRICDSGIKICLSYNEFYLMEYFYYYASLSYHNLGMIDERNQAIMDCYMVLKVKKNQIALEKFIKTLKADFGADAIDSIIK